MEKYKLNDIAKAIGVKSLIDGFVTDICTDTRKITKGSLFVALKGENFDGNDFCEKAIEMGAVAVVCNRDCGLKEKQFVVDNTGEALLKIAGAYRSMFNIPVIGVTGSVGKTSTKEMIHLVLSKKFNTLKNEGNQNNEIGVPLTLFRLDGKIQAAVVEMGMNHFGEIDRLTKIVKPSFCVISNIGVSHIENLGSREGILKAKLEIVGGMKKNSPIIVNRDNDMLSSLFVDGFNVKGFSLEKRDCEAFADEIIMRDGKTKATIHLNGESVKGEFPFVGEHNLMNALAAVMCGDELGITLEQSVEALKNYQNVGMRQRTVDKGNIRFIEDCYNASPDSQRAAMRVLGTYEGRRKIAVTGDMFELGDYSERAHSVVGEYAANNKIDIVFSVGDYSKFTVDKAKQSGVGIAKHFDTKQELSNELVKILKDGDVVLVKGSRGMRMEEVLKEVYEKI